MIDQKKNIFGIHIIFFITLLMAGSLFAQPQRQQRPPMLPDSTQITKIVDELVTTLSLNEKQTIEISDLYFTHFAKAKEMLEKHKGDRENHRQKMDSLRDEFEDQIKVLLNDEQKAEYDKVKKNRRPQPGKQRPGRK